MSGPQSIIRKFLIKQKDDALGRDRVGVDRFGNKYYQYYSYHGLPTKRIVLYKFFGTNQFNQDPHFLGWLRRNQILPPTQEELERLYIEHDAFVQKGIEWDEEQHQMINEFQNIKKQLDAKYDREDVSQTQKWIPGTKSEDIKIDQNKQEDIVQIEDESALAIIQEIDQQEELFIKEFEKIITKDQEDNKDFNQLALQELKKAQYFFAYMRTSEKLYNLEKKKQQLMKKEEEISQNYEKYQIEQIQQKNKDAIGRKQQINEILENENVGKYFDKNDLGKQHAYKPMNQISNNDNKRYQKFRNEFKDVFDQINQKKLENKEL